MASGNRRADKGAKAAARVRAAQQQKRQRLQWSVGIIVLVVVGIVVLVLAKPSTDSSSSDDLAAKPAPASIAADLAEVPMTSLSGAYAAEQKVAASASTDANLPTAITAANRAKYGALKSGGKPEVLYMGAEYCPHCANLRWPLVVALSKFGSFSGLKVITSSEDHVPTLSFVGATYHSDVLSFTPVELYDQDHKPLEKGTDAQMTLLQSLGQGGYPFVDFGGKYAQSGDPYNGSPFVGKTQTDIAAAVAKSSADATDITTMPGQVNAVAGSFVDVICDLTDDKPAKVCKALTAG